MAAPKEINEPKRYKIPSRSWGMTADEAADVLVQAEEIKMNNALLQAARKVVTNRLNATKKVANKI